MANLLQQVCIRNSPITNLIYILVRPFYKLPTRFSKLVDNLEQAVRTQLVGRLVTSTEVFTFLPERIERPPNTSETLTSIIYFLRLLLYPEDCHPLSKVETEADGFINLIMWFASH